LIRIFKNFAQKISAKKRFLVLMLLLVLVIPKQTSNAQPAFASYGAAGAKRPTRNLKKARDLIRSLQTRCRYGRYGRGENLRQRMSRFPIRYCVMEYEIILSLKTETAASAGGNLPDCSVFSPLNICANHYHL